MAIISTSSFLSNIGVRTAITYDGTPYTNFSSVLTALQYLGINTIRDGVPDPAGAAASGYNQLADAGIKFDCVIPGNGDVQLSIDLANLDTFAQAHPGAIRAIEAPNEVNIWPITYKGITDTFAAAVAVTKDLWAGTRSDPLLKNIAIYAPTLAVDTSGEALLGNLSPYVTYGNAHVYAAGGTNAWTNDMPYWLPVQAQPTPGLPTVVTETGYTMAASGDHVDQNVAAKYTLNTLFDDALHGVAMTYIFELADEPVSFGAPDMGLFNSDWTAKPAATAVHNLTSIIGAAGIGTPATTLNYSVSGLPDTGHSLLLASATAWDIAVWNDATIWNASTSKEIAAAAVPVTVSLGGTYQTVKLFDPMLGAAPIQTFSHVSSVNLSPSDHPLILEVNQNTVQPPTINTLTLRLSEDAWHGDAKFTVSVNGQQIGSTMSASALHGTGDSNVFVLAGHWGAHAPVRIQFLNDAYGGSATTDRNLYVNSLSYDGTTFPGAAMMSNSVVSFATSGTSNATAPADTLTLHLSEDAYLGNADFQVAIDGRQITTPQAVAALHIAGDWQDFSFAGNFGTGAHTVAITFTNDAYGGSPSTDRNLYVGGIAMNGAPYGSGVSPLNSTGQTVSYSVTTVH